MVGALYLISGDDQRALPLSRVCVYMCVWGGGGMFSLKGLEMLVLESVDLSLDPTLLP